MANTYTISDLAKEFDLTTRAIRFYEDMGLLQPERSGPGGRVRVYSSRDRTRLRLTLRAKRLGLSLIAAGHYATEFPVTAAVAEKLRAALPGVEVLVSTANKDPYTYL